MCLISVIIPAYNASKFIKEAIQSVLNQTFTNFELLIINDGSTDETKEIIQSISDPRVRYYYQKNSGVSVARNLGLAQMHGRYFCFVDADDVLPLRSLESRISIFSKSDDISFVDGAVQKMDASLEKKESIWRPQFYGEPLNDLTRLTGKSFFGPTWMIKRQDNIHYKLDEGLTHGEDLLFYMKLARSNGHYAFTDDIVLHYRNSPNSAMKNLFGLEEGYRYIESEIKKWPELNKKDLNTFGFKWRKAMFLDYLRSRHFTKAFQILHY